jgi:glycosyltransferase involved in cell wall biosynthesis
MMINVLHVYRTYFPDPPGGLQEAIRQIAISTKQQGITSRIFALSPKPVPIKLYRPEGEVFRSKSWAAPASCDLGGFSALTDFSGLLRWADVVHYHFPWPFADFLQLCVRPKVPAVMTYHSDIVRQRVMGKVYAPVRKHMMQSMARIVATSPAYARTSQILSSPSVFERVRVIPLGIDESTYSLAGDRTVFQRIGISEGEPFFLFIGVLRYYKGLHTLIEAARSVNAKVVIAGSGPEGSALQSQAKSSEASNVIFAGQVTDSEKISLLKHCYALVLPSQLRSEAFGMVLVEASMFGKPMISCEIGTGTSFVNAHGETGLVVAPESPDALANAMQRLLSNESLAKDYGEAARRRYEKLFSGDALGTAYANMYREIVDCNRSPH